MADGDFSVCTSALYSCVLITGYNEESFAGAFHYPAKRIEDNAVLADMNAWAHELEPTSVVLIFAPDSAGNGFWERRARTGRPSRNGSGTGAELIRKLGRQSTP